MWPVMAQSHPWTNVPSVDGASSTVGIIKMQEWCAKVGRCVYVLGMHINVCPMYLCYYIAFVQCRDTVVCYREYGNHNQI